MAYFNINEQKQYRQIPSTYKNSLGYNYADFSVHYADGFREIIEPLYNPEIEYKGTELILVVETPYDYFTYGVIPYTPEEIAQMNADKIDALDEQYVLSLEEAGLQLVRRHRKRLRRRVEENTTSFEDAKQVRKILRGIWAELKEGDFDWALEDAQAINQTTLNNGIKREINWLITRISDLITSNPLRKL
jgi:hypothetical protein